MAETDTQHKLPCPCPTQLMTQERYTCDNVTHGMEWARASLAAPTVPVPTKSRHNCSNLLLLTGQLSLTKKTQHPCCTKLRAYCSTRIKLQRFTHWASVLSHPLPPTQPHASSLSPPIPHIVCCAAAHRQQPQKHIPYPSAPMGWGLPTPHTALPHTSPKTLPCAYCAGPVKTAHAALKSQAGQQAVDVWARCSAHPVERCVLLPMMECHMPAGDCRSVLLPEPLHSTVHKHTPQHNTPRLRQNCTSICAPCRPSVIRASAPPMASAHSRGTPYCCSPPSGTSSRRAGSRPTL